MNPALLAWLTRLLWKPKPTHEVLGLPLSFSDRIEPRLCALTPHTAADLAEEIGREVEAILREGLADRGVPPATYTLVLGDDPQLTARIVRESDGLRWSLRDFDEFIDLGLHARGSIDSA